MRPFALNAALSPLFTSRWTDLALAKLGGPVAKSVVKRTSTQRPTAAPARAVAAPTVGIFGHGRGRVRVGGATAAQPDGVTCAATGLLLLNAACDRALEAWLAEGTIPESLPPEIAGLTPSDLAEPDPGHRLAAAAAAVHERATRATLGPFGWPRAYGTPPWGVAREARVPGVIYRHRAVDDQDRAVMDEVLAMLVAATTAGIPVPFYSGGDWSRGWQTAMPRHLVLALPTNDADRLRVYEPGSGRIETIAPDELRARSTPHRALGGWPHMAWTLIPIVR